MRWAVAGALFVVAVALCLPFDWMAKLTREDARRRMELAAELERLGPIESPHAGVAIRPDWMNHVGLAGDFLEWERERIEWIEKGRPVE